MKIDGHMAYQDFDVNWDDKGIQIQGHYPHQKFAIKFKDA
jgi:hypothetical protein